MRRAGARQLLRNARYNISYGDIERLATQRLHRHSTTHQTLQNRNFGSMVQVCRTAVTVEESVLLLLQNNAYLTCVSQQVRNSDDP